MYTRTCTCPCPGVHAHCIHALRIRTRCDRQLVQYPVVRRAPKESPRLYIKDGNDDVIVSVIVKRDLKWDPIGVDLKEDVKEYLKNAEVYIMTVHDMGSNHSMFTDFIDHPCMAALSAKAAWIQFDLPGQEEEAPDLPVNKHFPTLEMLGEDLFGVLDQLLPSYKDEEGRLIVPQVFAFGEGVGANIVARFAMKHPERLLGITLIHCTGTAAGFQETMKDKLMEWKLEHGKMNSMAEKYFVSNRFGPGTQKNAEVVKHVEEFRLHLHSKINAKNLGQFLTSFQNRTNILESIGAIKCDTLLVSGKLALHSHTVETLETAMKGKFENKKKIDCLLVDDVANVIVEKPEKLAESLQYFVQGLGKASTIPMTGSRTRIPSVSSMEEADIPKMSGASPPKGTSPLAK